MVFHTDTNVRNTGEQVRLITARDIFDNPTVFIPIMCIWFFFALMLLWAHRMEGVARLIPEMPHFINRDAELQGVKGALNKYRLSVKTGTRPFAGLTSGNEVIVELRGDDGQDDAITLDADASIHLARNTKSVWLFETRLDLDDINEASLRVAGKDDNWYAACALPLVPDIWPFEPTCVLYSCKFQVPCGYRTVLGNAFQLTRLYATTGSRYVQYVVLSDMAFDDTGFALQDDKFLDPFEMDRRSKFFWINEWVSIYKEVVAESVPFEEFNSASSLFSYHVSESVSDKHFVASMFLSSPTSPFTPPQRVAVCMLLLNSIVFANAFFFQGDADTSWESATYIGKMFFARNTCVLQPYPAWSIYLKRLYEIVTKFHFMFQVQSPV